MTKGEEAKEENGREEGAVCSQQSLVGDLYNACVLLLMFASLWQLLPMTKYGTTTMTLPLPSHSMRDREAKEEEVTQSVSQTLPVDDDSDQWQEDDPEFEEELSRVLAHMQNDEAQWQEDDPEAAAVLNDYLSQSAAPPHLDPGPSTSNSRENDAKIPHIICRLHPIIAQLERDRLSIRQMKERKNPIPVPCSSSTDRVHSRDVAPLVPFHEHFRNQPL